jgi:tRNA-specific 2-thiouridylase
MFYENCSELRGRLCSDRSLLQKESNRGQWCTVYQLRAGADNNRSYFLCQLSQEQLSKSLFPIGELTKPEVREIAAQMELVTAEKDSQGLCFIGKFTGIFTTKLQPIEGSIIQIDKMMAYMRFKSKKVVSREVLSLASNKNIYSEMGKVVGKHQGAHYFTIGQRKGLNVGGIKIRCLSLRLM